MVFSTQISSLVKLEVAPGDGGIPGGKIIPGGGGMFPMGGGMNGGLCEKDKLKLLETERDRRLSEIESNIKCTYAHTIVLLQSFLPAGVGVQWVGAKLRVGVWVVYRKGV